MIAGPDGIDPRSMAVPNSELYRRDRPGRSRGCRSPWSRKGSGGRKRRRGSTPRCAKPRNGSRSSAPPSRRCRSRCTGRLRIWPAITAEGAAEQMIWQRQRHQLAGPLRHERCSTAIPRLARSGRRAPGHAQAHPASRRFHDTHYHGRYYAKAQNLARRCCGRPTTTCLRAPRPTADADDADRGAALAGRQLQPAEDTTCPPLEMIDNTCPFDGLRASRHERPLRHGRRPARRDDAGRPQVRRGDRLLRRRCLREVHADWKSQ